MKQAIYTHYPIVDNRYRIIESLGSGGMATVYLAYDEVLDRDVALKVLSHRLTDDEEFVERFRREARIAAALSHPNIASVHDLGETENGSYYMAMEYVPGGTLRDHIRQKGALPPSTAVVVALQVAQALKVAHAHGTIHRDIKPHNILLTEAGVVKVVDFGIARAAAFSEITREGHVLGTEHYMSPEQAKGELVGPSSDLYSLGVVLYEMLTGKLPHEAYGPLLGSATVAKRLSSYPRPPKEEDPLIADKLSAITVRLLSEDPERRYPDASSLIADLEKAKRESPTSVVTKVLSTALQKGRTLGSAMTRALNSAARHAQAAYKKTHKTKPYIPSAPKPRLRGGRCKPGQGQRQRVVPRFVLVLLTFAAVLVSLNIVGPSAKARLLGGVERALGDSLGGIQRNLNGAMAHMERNLESAFQSALAEIEQQLGDGFKSSVTPSPNPQQGPESYSNSLNDTGGSSSQGPDNSPPKKRPDKGSEKRVSPPQNDPFSQDPSGSYTPTPRSPSYPSDGPGGSFSPGMSNPLPYSLPNNSNDTPRQGFYQQSRQEVEKQIDKNLKSLERVFGQRS